MRRKMNLGRWGQSLRFFSTDYWKDIKEKLREDRENGRKYYPSSYKKILRPLLETPLERVRVVIVGQDPYFKEGMADGLAFSVLPNHRGKTTRGDGGGKIPPSLANIFKEYREDLGFRQPRTGDLSAWARNGILLINSVWTVGEVPGTHDKIRGRMAWQELTAEIITRLSRRSKPIVFIFWGRKARELAYLVHDKERHLILEGGHPSPRNKFHNNPNILKFNGGKYFTKAADFLGVDKAMWRLP